MATNYQISFSKFHGMGNDFIVATGRGLPASFSRLARALLHPHTGLGADGLIVILPARSRKHHARVRFLNADGSEAEMSGNGIRCAAAFLVGGSRSPEPLKVETLAGVRNIEAIDVRQGKWTFRVAMGAPILEPRKIPFKAGDFAPPLVGFPLRTQGGLVSVTVTSMGNPHCSTFVQDFASLDWHRLGREIETSKLFPHRTNVEFVRVISRKEIEVRYWERGVGETASSGTGSCGAVVASILNGLTGRKVRVRTLAGNLLVEWPNQGEVILTGPVERIAMGTYFYRG